MARNPAIKTLASTFGVLVGLAGVEHGIFEMLQGNVVTGGLMIDAIGPAHRVWEYATEPALTVIPNFLVSGILATVFGVLVAVWAGMFIDRRYGAWIFGLLSLIVWLVGGGFAPIFMSIFAFAAAMRMNSSLQWWRTHLSPRVRGALARLWPGAIIVYVFVFVFAVEIQVFGYPLLWVLEAELTYTIQWTLAIIMVLLWPVSILTAFASDTIDRG
jgi:hypothetical protein